jgi:hypothetical protein
MYLCGVAICAVQHLTPPRNLSALADRRGGRRLAILLAHPAQDRTAITLGNEMNPLKLLALLLIVGGGLGLAYGGFTYTKATHTTDIGPMHLEVKEKQHINIPLWAGLVALIGGGLLLVAPLKS